MDSASLGTANLSGGDQDFAYPNPTQHSPDVPTKLSQPYSGSNPEMQESKPPELYVPKHLNTERGRLARIFGNLEFHKARLPKGIVRLTASDSTVQFLPLQTSYGKFQTVPRRLRP